jgi:hypothetical protein
MDTPLETEGGAMTKSCPACFTVVPLDIMTCPECGYAFPLCDGEGEKRERLEDLIELLPPDEKKKRQAFIKYASYAYENGMSPNWASHMFKKKFLKWPAPTHRFRAVFGNESGLENQEAYLQYLIASQQQKPSKDPEAFIRNHMEWEFGEALLHVDGLPNEQDPEEEILVREKVEDSI